jgi:DNA-binding transcriptional LysR family regulator
MELRLLRSFVAVAEERHFSRAAARLHIAQPPLSRQIQHLEAELGVQLLHRTRRQVALTEAGRQFLASSRSILAQVEAAVSQARRVARGEEGRIAIGMVSSVAFGDALPRLLRRFRASHPAVSITLQEMSAGEQLEALQAGRIQVGFMRSPAPEARMVVTPFYREPLVAVLPAGHPLAGRRSLPLKALARDAFISVPRNRALGGADLVLEACLQAGFTPEVFQEALELQSVIGYVAAGFGVSLLPRTARKLVHAGVAFVTLASPRMTLEISAVHLNHSDSPVLGAFLAALRPGSGKS